MSVVFKWLLVCTSFFFAGGFLWLAIYAGHVFPKGPAPFYIIAAVCGIAGLCFLSVRPIPFEGGIMPQAALPARSMDGDHSDGSAVHEQTEDLDDVSVHGMDLTRISPAGCMLCVTTAIVFFFAAGAAAVFAPAMLENRATQKIVGWSILGVGAVYFIVGRFVLKILGFTFMRKRR